MREMSVLGSSVLRARTGKFGVEMMTDALSKLRELKGKWRRWAKRDCDPANGSAAAQQRGQLLANCADDLEALLRALEQRERELREALEAVAMIPFLESVRLGSEVYNSPILGII